MSLAEAVRARQAGPAEIVDQVLTTIRTQDRDLNSVVVVLESEARKAAEAAQRAIDAGERLGPLHGVPVTIKEPIWVEGAPSTNGSKALADFRAPTDSTAVARLRRAGAIVVGKTNIPEMQFRGICDNPIYGLTVNPWDPARTSGGSSGGAAASLAAGFTPLALGSDGGGSIRIPASWCGVAGLKPSRGLIPTGPARAGAPSVSVLGPLARSARDLGLMLDTLAGDGETAVPRTSSAADASWVRGLRIAYSADLGFAPCADEVRAAFEEQIDMLREDGWNLTPAHPEADDPTPVWYRIFETELYAANRDLVASSPELIDGLVLEALQRAAKVTAPEYLDAQFASSVYREKWTRFFDDYDILLTPGSAIPAFEAGRMEPGEVSGRKSAQPNKVAFASAMLPANVTGFPALNVPSFLTGGMPVGLQMMGRHGADRVLVRAGSAYEAVRGAWSFPFRRPV
ncbi:amidase [Streptomyces sp. BH106]|uniref:amidase n=1 Tax=Streptomyces sp. BH106 TaxID=3410409 RepID=UPI003CE7628E